jgi:murein DD-endopeptidase MepM/ murein hydrolase activator NlpD
VTEPRERPELWTRLAYLPLLALVLLGGYLAARPGGRGPIAAYLYGPSLVALVAFVLLLVALVVALRRRPVFAPHRRVPFLCLLVAFAAATFPFPYPSSRENRPSAVRFRLPVEGTWRVYWGGDSKETNVLYGYSPDRRWALYFVRDDSPSYAVLAPADGKVVLVRDLGAGLGPRPPDPFRGLVVIEVAPDEFLFVSNLAPRIQVGEGDTVLSGDVLGRVGMPGESPMFIPGLYIGIHLQTTPVPLWGEAIPWRFHDYEADGARVESGLPRGGIGPGGALAGQRVRNLPD